MTLKADEFIRRFLLHVLPSRYVRIRHFGLLANRTRKDNIAACRKILGGAKPLIKENLRQKTWQEQLLRICGIDVTTCTVCQKGGCSGWHFSSPIDATAHRSLSGEDRSQSKTCISGYPRKEHPVSPCYRIPPNRTFLYFPINHTPIPFAVEPHP